MFRGNNKIWPASVNPTATITALLLNVIFDNSFYPQHETLKVKVPEMQVKAVLFDLFNTLVLLENADAFTCLP